MPKGHLRLISMQGNLQPWKQSKPKMFHSGFPRHLTIVSKLCATNRSEPNSLQQHTDLCRFGWYCRQIHRRNTEYSKRHSKKRRVLNMLMVNWKILQKVSHGPFSLKHFPLTRNRKKNKRPKIPNRDHLSSKSVCKNQKIL